MAATRSQSLGAATSSIPGEVLVLHTVPPQLCTIVKSVYATNANSVDLDVTLLVILQGAVVVELARKTLVSLESLSWSGWLVLEEGDSLRVVAEWAGLHVAASGAVLFQAPDP